MREKEQRSLLSKGVEKQKENKGKECAKSKKVRLKKGSMGEKEAGVGLSVLFCAQNDCAKMKRIEGCE